MWFFYDIFDIIVYNSIIVWYIWYNSRTVFQNRKITAVENDADGIWLLNNKHYL